MEINKIGSSDAVQQSSNHKKNVSVSQEVAVKKDEVNVSVEGKQQLLYKQAMEIIKNTPEIRNDKIEEAKKLLESFKNPSDLILSDVSNKILKDFGLV